mmetsp:Transcript_2006/g.2683  ORF Transcript_2006/g.2683 Transcript_2006/m.2683 type:complete len:164 (+) Transcript_2006:224-715(+)
MFSRDVLFLLMLPCVYGLNLSMSTGNSNKLKVNARRAFIAKTAAMSVTSLGILSLKHNHENGDECVACKMLGIDRANAFYERDAGDENSSAVTKAFNIQAKKTNARLEASGFALDTKEEEESKISDAFKTFSYDSYSPQQKVKGTAAKGVGSINADRDTRMKK